MKANQIGRIVALALLTLIISTRVVQAVHIFTENPLTFEAFAKYLTPSGEFEDTPHRIAELCTVDDYTFYQHLQADSFLPEFIAETIASCEQQRTCEKLSAHLRHFSLRAPPGVA